MNVVSTDKNIGEVGLPLPLLLDGFHNGSRVRASNDGIIVVVVGEVLG
jgi:hypothetical protein